MDSERSECITGEKEMGMEALPGDTMGGSAANTERWKGEEADMSDTDELALGGVTSLPLVLPAPPTAPAPPLPVPSEPGRSSMSSSLSALGTAAAAGSRTEWGDGRVSGEALLATARLAAAAMSEALID